MKRKISVAMVFALAVVMAGAVALAAASGMGILDFAGRYNNVYIPEDAQSYIQSDVSTIEQDGVVVNIRELYYDGRTTRMIVDVTPRNDKTLLLGTDCSMKDNWQNLWRDADGGWDDADERTVYDLYVQKGCASAYSVNVWTVDEEHGTGGGGTMDYTLGEDGTLTVFREANYEDDRAEREITLKVGLTPFTDPEKDELDDSRRMVAEQRMTLTSAATNTVDEAGVVQGVYVNTEPVVYESIGVRVDRVMIEEKPQELYATIDYTVIDRELYQKTDDGLVFSFIDPSKTGAIWEQRLTGGITSGGQSHPIDGNLETATRYRQEETLGKNELHETYTLGSYECWNKTRFEDKSFTMRPATQADIDAAKEAGEPAEQEEPKKEETQGSVEPENVSMEEIFARCPTLPRLSAEQIQRVDASAVTEESPDVLRMIPQWLAYDGQNLAMLLELKATGESVRMIPRCFEDESYDPASVPEGEGDLLGTMLFADDSEAGYWPERTERMMITKDGRTFEMLMISFDKAAQKREIMIEIETMRGENGEYVPMSETWQTVHVQFEAKGPKLANGALWDSQP